MNRKHLIAIATIAFAGATAATAAPMSQEEWAGPTPVAAQSSHQPLSRAEVIADANLWHRAGLDKYQVGERSPASDPMYQERLAEYQRLRSGPEYVAEVRRLGGDVSAVASMYEHGTVPMTN
ncbi:DUF4148 domain-containing protein [Paracidovorax oryzae]|uniref:DUF4148 domain-containing protein n=1 Tax=Paracidovorax oryzae TaxID=862720 RepID=UPI0003069507|nr:DUF4148 domain-containing protein [Paracidovorax oryzae]